MKIRPQCVGKHMWRLCMPINSIKKEVLQINLQLILSKFMFDSIFGKLSRQILFATKNNP